MCTTLLCLQAILILSAFFLCHPYIPLSNLKNFSCSLFMLSNDSRGYSSGVTRGGGDSGVRTPPSVSTSLIIHYSQSTYNSLHDTAQTAPAPSEKTITGAASSRYALEVDRMSEQSAGIRSIRYVRTHTRCHTYPRSAHVQKLQIRAEHPPFTNPGYATAVYIGLCACVYLIV